MTQNIKDLSAEILLNLEKEIGKRLPEKRAEDVAAFASIYLSTVADEDLLNWRLDDLYGAVLSSWEYLQEKTPGQPKVRVFNPEFEQYGWQSTHTTVQVLSDDLPFILDSLRVELNRRNLGTHAVHNSVITLKRDERNRFDGFLSANSRAGSTCHETLITVEVDRDTDLAQLQDLEQTLYDVFYEVAMAVEDFQPMLAKADELVAMYDAIPVAKQPEGMPETREFVSWLKENFTFLGYDEYQLASSRSKQLQPEAGSQLGLLKYCDEYCRAELINDEQRYIGQFTLIPELLSFTKSPTKSRVHRPAYPDYITVKRFDKQGKAIGESRFLGLYTSEVYLGNARQIPVVRKKVDAVLKRSERQKFGHDWKELQQILEIHPRDDLFQASIDELYETAFGILHIHERRQIRLFLRRDPLGQYVSCLVYAPRDIYSTEFRLKAEKILLNELGCNKAEFNTYFSESILARTHFVLRSDKVVQEHIDIDALQRKIQAASKSWSDELYEGLIEALGEELGISAFNNYGRGFSTSYRDDFTVRTAVVDVQHMSTLSGNNPLVLSFYRALEQGPDGFNFKLFHLDMPLPLAEVLPVLENLGLRVIDEHPYSVSTSEAVIWIHDFNLICSDTVVDIHQMKSVFQDAFMAIWSGAAANDEFNRLVLSAGLDWRQVKVLRAYAAYMKQIRFSISGSAISATLNSYRQIAKLLVALFAARFLPGKSSVSSQQKLEEQVIAALADVVSLNDDKVIRQYLALIKATLRTNFYQLTNSAELKPDLALKVNPAAIPEMPDPKPQYEIFVFSPRLEGVHLRGAKVARGGVRLSDREEDYRTEALDMVKAQQVKNAIIVPVGASGCFVAKKLRANMHREELYAEGSACYRTFVSALLDITDNLVEGKVVSPDQVVCHDADDPYLVVEADTGTANFTDIANEVAAEYGYWLGDAFASGGSQGYDRKKMGITARGAWMCVDRHFRELGVNIATTAIRVVGVGDMSGDVFGNGMLQSKHICLLASFNHQYIFIDPEPDPAASWKERKRLFDLPDSGWNEYDRTLISRGGGVFKRSAKSIVISAQMQRCFDISEHRLTPNELASRLLCAPVDLLWSAGIGTFIKASCESQAEVGDKINDALRVDACELRCRVIGEGNNRSITQQARVEYAQGLGHINADFIDNAAGVDCADHEVNIKILLNDIVAAGDMTEMQRNRLLVKMTDDVAHLVLDNNYRQAQSISLEQVRGVAAMGENRRFISSLEGRGKFDRKLAFIPDDESLAQRQVEGIGLTRPELSVLISYSKAVLKEQLIKSTVADDVLLSQEITTAFPACLVDSYPQALQQHYLRRELIVTQLANNLVNYMGFKFIDHLQGFTRASIEDVTRAYVLARDVFDMQQFWSQIEALDFKVDAAIQVTMMQELQMLIRRASRWFVLNRSFEKNVSETEVRRFRQTIAKVSGEMGDLLCGQPKIDWHEAYQRYTDAAVPQQLAAVIAGTRSLYAVLGVIDVAAETEVPVKIAAQSLFAVGEHLQLHWLIQCLNGLERENYWQVLACESFRDDIEIQQLRIVTALLNAGVANGDLNTCLASWCEQHKTALARWLRMVSDLKCVEKQDYAIFTVALSELVELTKACS